VIVPPGELQVYARVSVRASNVTVDFSGSIVNCYMADTCILAGDPSNANAFLDITLLNPRGRPMVVNGQNPFIEVDIVYTAGLAVITDPVKFACAQIVRNAQATPALNVKTGKVDVMRMDYFSDSLIDQNVQAMLAPYVAQKVG
jgi:hypothetical protein